MADPKVKRVLISVTDKTGVVEFARALHDEFGAEIISTGGTARVIAEAGVPVTPIDEVTKFPEMMDGRVKTLHPMVHGGLLAKRDNAKHMAEAAEHGIQMIDMVVVNLYAFEKTVESGADFGTCIENIDIGGPSMLRSAAKNFESVTVVTDPETYEGILAEMRANGGATTRETRMELALEVFETTNAYDGAIADFLFDQVQAAHPHEHGEGCGCGCEEGIEAQGEFPPECALYMQKQQDLRYGENPHQQAVFYRVDEFAHEHSLVNAQQLNGKELSYNNILDTDACWSLVRELDEPAVIILKHQNPCGSATAENITEAYDKAFACDPKSAFGGIIAANRQVTLEMVEHINENKQFVEVLIAPEFESAALELLQQKKNLRVLRTGGIGGLATLLDTCGARGSPILLGSGVGSLPALLRTCRSLAAGIRRRTPAALAGRTGGAAIGKRAAHVIGIRVVGQVGGAGVHAIVTCHDVHIAAVDVDLLRFVTLVAAGHVHGPAVHGQLRLRMERVVARAGLHRGAQQMHL